MSDTMTDERAMREGAHAERLLRRIVAQEVTRAVATGPEATEAAAYEIRECMTRALVDWSHIGETWIVRAGESRARGVIEVYNGAIDGRPGDTIELRRAATGRRVWRVVDRLHSVDDRCLTLWVEPT